MFRKGDLVELNEKTCFTTRNGGDLPYPLTHSLNDCHGIVEGYRPTTAKETREFYESDYGRGLDSAGESILCSPTTIVEAERDFAYEVVRARAQCQIGWGRKYPGYTKLRNRDTGEEFFIKRNLLRPADILGNEKYLLWKKESK